ncbi:uncharacterized protein LOC122839739 isoform X2 [Gambusia affinis]|uniref:uncharacterized protein LOC122839739 isoform X2 n=1 Tax=Gambusia affinis TaxID=33528 RepID=UPI001CDCEAE7|nr:uncharacterized protein LOC122839739 isoform X2 [Gambusia affinis]
MQHYTLMIQYHPPLLQHHPPFSNISPCSSITPPPPRSNITPPAPTSPASPPPPLQEGNCLSPPSAPTSPPAPASPPSSLPITPLPSASQGKSLAEKYVQDAFTGKNVFVLLSKVNAYKLFYFDINKIGPDMELESQSINAFMAVIVKDYNSQNTGQAAFIDSFAMTAMWQGKSPRLKKMNPMNYEIILGINNQHHHWTLVVIYPQEKKSLFLNPLGESKQDIQKCLQITRAFMRKKGCNVSRWTCDTVKHPKQQDSTSCGVFSLKFAEKILSKEVVDFPVSNEAVYSMRLEIAVRLILNSDDLKDLCHFCGEMESDSDVNWDVLFG